MDFFLILVAVSVIGTIISAVAKNKKREEARREQQQQPGQRPLSDIQRAAMMAQETASQRPATPQRPAYQPHPAYAQQYGAPQRPAYTPQQPAAYTPMQARTVAPPEARSAAPMEARTGTTPYRGSMNVVTNEGRGDSMEGGKPADITRNLQSITEANLESVSGAKAPAKPLQTAAPYSAATREPLNLFKGKNEIVKAIIYAEVLKRRSPGRRAGRA